MNNEPPRREYEIDVVDFETGTSHKAKILTGLHYTDKGNAERFALHWENKVHYCADDETWYIWNGCKWEADTKGKIRECAKEVVEFIHYEGASIKSDDPVNRSDTNTLKREAYAWAFKSESARAIKAMIELAASDPRIAIIKSEFDANKALRNFPNGTLDLNRREFREHRREDLLTKSTAVPYDEFNAEPTYFHATLQATQTEDERINLQRRLGLMLEATTKNKEILFIYGAPYSGRSSITQAVYNALGDYASVFDVAIFEKSKHHVSPSRAKPELMALNGVLLAWSEEIHEAFVVDDAFLKSVTSSGKKHTRDLYEKQEELELVCSFALETNGAVIIDIEDDWQREAALERIAVSTFMDSIPKEERNPEVLKIMTESEPELKAALLWVFQGYFDRKDYGLIDSEDTRNGLKRFQNALNPVSSFVVEGVIIDDGKKDGKVHAEVVTYLSDIFERFQDTAPVDVVEKVKDERTFNKHFKQAIAPLAERRKVTVYAKRRTGGHLAWYNIRLSESDDRVSGSNATQEREDRGKEARGGVEKEAK